MTRVNHDTQVQGAAHPVFRSAFSLPKSFSLNVFVNTHNAFSDYYNQVTETGGLYYTR